MKKCLFKYLKIALMVCICVLASCGFLPGDTADHEITEPPNLESIRVLPLSFNVPVAIPFYNMGGEATHCFIEQGILVEGLTLRLRHGTCYIGGNIVEQPSFTTIIDVRAVNAHGYSIASVGISVEAIVTPPVVTPPTPNPQVVPPPTAPQVVTPPPIPPVSPPPTEPQVVPQPPTEPQVVPQPPTEPQVIPQPPTEPQVVPQPPTEPQVVPQPPTEPQVVPQPPAITAPLITLTSLTNNQFHNTTLKYIRGQETHITFENTGGVIELCHISLGNMPQGLYLTQNTTLCRISGTPILAEESRFEVTFSNRAGSQTLQVHVVILEDSDSDGIPNTVDVDDDNDGLIEISTPRMLHNIRYNLSGTAYNTSAEADPNTYGASVQPTQYCSRQRSDGYAYLCGYELTNDINFDANNNGYTWRIEPDGSYTIDHGDYVEPYFTADGWQPIGEFTDYSVGFNAIFEGNGHRIIGLAVSQATEQFVGLFRSTHDSSHIRNLRLEQNLVIGSHNVGGLVGFAQHGHIERVEVSGVANGESSTGGLVGYSADANIESSAFSGQVIAKMSAGGLVGVLHSGEISTSRSSGLVRGSENNIGGLVGKSKGIISYSRSSSSVTGKDYVGGLVGKSENTIESGSAEGTVEGTNYVGGLVGHANAEISQSTAEGTVEGNDYVGGLAGKAEGEVHESSASGNVSGVKNIGGLAGETTSRVSESSASGDSEGERYVGGLVGRSYSGSIVASHATGNVRGLYSEDNRYSGRSIGGLGGSTKTVIASYATGNVSGIHRTGGLVGITADGRIVASYATGNVVQSREYVGINRNDVARIGGLAGVVHNSQVSAGYATGNTSGYKQVGGFIGYSIGSWGIITAAANYSVGSVSGVEGEQFGSFYGLGYGTTVRSFGFGTVANNSTEGSASANYPHLLENGIEYAINLRSASDTNAGSEWNDPANNTQGAWNFDLRIPNDDQNKRGPTLVYADYDGEGNLFYCEGSTKPSENSIAIPHCGQPIPHEGASRVQPIAPVTLSPEQSFTSLSLSQTISGIWSNGETIWVSIYDECYSILAFDLISKQRVPSKDFPNLVNSSNYDLLTNNYLSGLVSSNYYPIGIASNGETMWVVDYLATKIFAYDMETKQYTPEKDFNTLRLAGNQHPQGLWTDGTTMWVPDSLNRKVFAYNVESKERDPSKDISTGYDTLGLRSFAPRGAWSDGETMWIIKWDWSTNDEIIAVHIDMETNIINEEKNISNTVENIQTLWSNNGSMWIAENYSYF